MSDESKLYFLGSIVDDFIDDHDLTEHFYAKAAKWAIRGIEELRLDAFQDVKSCLLEVTDRKTVVCPPGYVKWTKVGGVYGQYVITLGVNDDLNRLDREPNACGVIPTLGMVPPNGLDFSSYGGYYFAGTGNGVLGIGGGIPSKGTFKEVNNGTCKELLLDYDFSCSHVYMEYITNGFDPCDDSVIHPFMKDYILKYLDFQYERLNNPKATINSIHTAGRALWHAEQVYRARTSNLDPYTFLNLTRKHYRLTAKT